MTRTSNRPVPADAPAAAINPAGPAAPDAGPARKKSDRSSPAAVPHRNEVVVVGELTPPMEPRRRQDGSEVLTFRVAVRTPSAGEGRGAPPPPPKEPSPTGRRDILDCVAGPATVRRRLEACLPGDVIELNGALRHRFWNSAGRVQSRYEIEVIDLRRLARERSRQPKP